ncbi:glycolipid transfer protein [Trifolium repens]|nr:glycolipid transfer protein [Trifolium repens]
MDFLVALFRNLIEHPGWAMSQACTDSYNKTLKKWHGWLASSSFTVAMKLAPDTKKFMEVIQGGETVILISSTNRHSKRVNVTWFFLPQKSPFSTLCTLLILMSVAEKMEMRVSAFYTT